MVYIKVISKLIAVKSAFSSGIFLYVESTIIKILTIVSLLCIGLFSKMEGFPFPANQYCMCQKNTSSAFLSAVVSPV